MTDQPWSYFVRWLDPDQPASSKEIRPYVGGTLEHGRRTIGTVEQRFFLTLDADYADGDFTLDVATLLHDTPYLIHTTWRHRPEAHRYRLIIPLDRGTGPNEYKELAWMVMNRLGGSRFDVTTAQAERFMWAPSSQDSDTYFWEAPNPRAPYLPVDEWLDGHHGPSDSRGTPGQGKATPATPATPSEALSASAEDVERAEEILASAVDDVLHMRERGQFAGRNEAVFHLLPLLLRFAEAGALDEDLVLDSLFNATRQVEADEPYTRQEFNASVQSARQYAEEDGPTLPETTRTRLAQADFADVEVEGEIDLWVQTPRLQHIAQAADNLGRNRLAMLAAVLVRVLVSVDAGICLAGAQDGSVGSRAALNLGVALVGSSGQGKSTIQEQSGLLIHTPHGLEQKPSTGQGLIQEYLKWDEDDQTHHVIDDPRRLFFFDEVDTLTASAADKTSTLMSEIRTMLTGGATGTANATAQRRRFLPARSYNFQMVLNVQPSRAGGLLRDRDAGTPQRFIWVTVTDPERAVRPKDRPSWPGPLDWNDAFLLEYDMGQREFVDMPQWLKDELLEYDYRVSLEGMEGGEISWAAHRNLLRLKVSAGIAFLHESPEITTDHVHLADQIISDSMKVQRACESLIAETSFNEQVGKARSEDKVLETVGWEKVTRLVKTAKKHLAAASGEWVNWRELRPAHRDRAEWGERVWEALEADDTVETKEVDINSAKVRREARFIP